MTQTQIALEFLGDGKPHSHREVYRELYMNPNVMSRLRQDGHNVRCWREGDTWWYQLTDSVAERPPSLPPEGEDTPGGSSATENLFSLETYSKKVDRERGLT